MAQSIGELSFGASASYSLIAIALPAFRRSARLGPSGFNFAKSGLSSISVGAGAQVLVLIARGRFIASHVLAVGAGCCSCRGPSQTVTASQWISKCGKSRRLRL